MTSFGGQDFHLKLPPIKVTSSDLMNISSDTESCSLFMWFCNFLKFFFNYLELCTISALLQLFISLLFYGALKSAWSKTDTIYFIIHITYFASACNYKKRFCNFSSKFNNLLCLCNHLFGLGYLALAPNSFRICPRWHTWCALEVLQNLS